MRDGTRVPRLRVQRSHSDSISNGLWKSDTLEFKVAIKVAGSQSKRNPGIDSTSQVAIRPCEQPGVTWGHGGEKGKSVGGKGDKGEEGLLWRLMRRIRGGDSNALESRVLDVRALGYLDRNAPPLGASGPSSTRTSRPYRPRLRWNTCTPRHPPRIDPDGRRCAHQRPAPSQTPRPHLRAPCPPAKFLSLKGAFQAPLLEGGVER
eukprot:1183678-Prorocentrum_minimum.AAC.2